MAQPAPVHVVMERLAGDMHALSFDMAEASRSIGHSERKTAEGERIAAAAHAIGDQVRRLFRGG